MSNPFSLFGERSLTLVAASFSDRRRAREAADALCRDSQLDGEVTVVGPGDPMRARKFEPEQNGIWCTLLRAHLFLGIVGAVAGVLATGAVLATGWAAALHSPGYLLLFLTVMGAFAGMMAGGLLTLRPDHGFVIRAMRDSLRQRQWAVVVRPLNRLQVEAAVSGLQRAGARPMRSF